MKKLPRIGIAWLLGVLLLSFPGVALGQAGDTAAGYYARARSENDPEMKIKYYSIALKLDPLHAGSLLGRAEAYLQQNRIGQAVQDLEVFGSKLAPTADFLVLRGKVAERDGRLDLAAEFYDAALVLDRNHHEANLRKGLHLLTLASLRSDTSLYEQSIPYLEKVSKDSPFYGIALNQLARCYEYFRDYGKAVDAYNKLIEREPKRSAFHFQLGRLLYFLGKNAEGLRAVNQAATLTFSDPQPQVFFGIFRYYLAATVMGDETSGVYQLGLFLERLPASPLLDLFKGTMPPEDFQNLIEEETAAPGLSENRRKALQCERFCQLGYYYLVKGDVDQALTAFEKAVKEGAFGAYYFYLARYEWQRLSLAREIGL